MVTMCHDIYNPFLTGNLCPMSTLANRAYQDEMPHCHQALLCLLETEIHDLKTEI